MLTAQSVSCGRSVLFTACPHISSRLERDACISPPELITPRAPVPDINAALLCDQQNLLFALHSDFLSLVEHARCLYMP